MKSNGWVTLILLVLALTALACSPGGNGGGRPATGQEVISTKEPGAIESTPETGEEVAATKEPAPTKEESGGTDDAPTLEVEEDALSRLDSYRKRTIIQWTPESGEAERLVIEEEYTREPPAHRMLAGDKESSIEWIQIEDTTWFCLDEMCSLSQENAEDTLAGIGQPDFEPDSLVGGWDARYTGKETINDVEARHYVANLSTIEAMALAQGEIIEVQAEIWIADEAGLPAFVVRYAQTWKEKRTEGTVSGEYSYEIYDVNKPFTIEPPENAAEVPDDVPVYPDATDLFVMEGMIGFSSADDVTTVANYYQTELATLGWTNVSDSQAEGNVFQVWSKDERMLNLMISKEDEGCSVAITQGM